MRASASMTPPEAQLRGRGAPLHWPNIGQLGTGLSLRQGLPSDSSWRTPSTCSYLVHRSLTTTAIAHSLGRCQCRHGFIAVELSWRSEGGFRPARCTAVRRHTVSRLNSREVLRPGSIVQTSKGILTILLDRANFLDPAKAGRY